VLLTIVREVIEIELHSHNMNWVGGWPYAQVVVETVILSMKEWRKLPKDTQT
jgi:hypothetical protein